MTVDVELTIGQEVIPGFGSLSFYSAAARGPVSAMSNFQLNMRKCNGKSGAGIPYFWRMSKKWPT